MIKTKVNDMLDLVQAWKTSVNKPEKFLIWVQNEETPLKMNLPENGQKWKTLGEQLTSLEDTNVIQKIHALAADDTLISSHDIEFLKEKESEIKSSETNIARMPGRYENIEVRKEVSEMEIFLEKQIEFFKTLNDSWVQQSEKNREIYGDIVDKLLELFQQQSDRVMNLETMQSNNTAMLSNTILENAKTQAALIAAASNEDSPLSSLLPAMLPSLMGNITSGENQNVPAPQAVTQESVPSGFLELWNTLSPPLKEKAQNYFIELLTENNTGE